MGKVIDLTGKRFGRLIVIKRVENNKWGKSMWLCKCDCGNEKINAAGDLNTGKSKSCGCLNKEIVSKLNKKYNVYDLTGEYGIGYTSKGEEFYFDLEDYDLIKNYCWRYGSNKYVQTHNLSNKYLSMHRLVMNCPDDMEVDHIYHINHDNRKSKLRIVTRSQNQMNQKGRINNKTGKIGVRWLKKDKRWRASITVNKKTINLGSFKNINDAIKIREQAELEYFGEYKYVK